MTPREEIISNLMRLHSAKLTGYTRMFCRDVETARDVVSDAFLKLCTMAEVNPDTAAAWLYKTCRNRAIDVSRHEKFSISLDDADALSQISADGANNNFLSAESDNAATASENNSRAEAVLEFIKELPPRQSEFLILRFYSDLSYAEIAKTASVPLGTVGATIARALETLKSKISARREI